MNNQKYFNPVKEMITKEEFEDFVNNDLQLRRFFFYAKRDNACFSSKDDLLKERTEFNLCLNFLSYFDLIKSIQTAYTTYSYKHMLETFNYRSNYPDLVSYSHIGNNIMVAAIIYYKSINSDFDYKIISRCPVRLQINISKKSDILKVLKKIDPSRLW